MAGVFKSVSMTEFWKVVLFVRRSSQSNFRRDTATL